MLESQAISTVTAGYSLKEDRIYMDAELHTGVCMRLFITQPLARLIVSELTKNLVKPSNNLLTEQFHQADAVNNKIYNEPVKMTDETARSLLVSHLHIQSTECGRRLIFAENDECAVHLNCDDAILRNFIDIFYKSFLKASWPRDIFPAWVNIEKAVSIDRNVLN